MQKTLFSSLLALSLSAVFGVAHAASEVPLYDGKTLSQDNIAVGNWGGGTASESTELFLFGGHSVKVTTLDPYQGAKITLLKPAALAGTDRMFQLTLQRGPVTLHYDPQTVPGAVPTGPTAAPGGYPGGPPGGYPGGPPGGYPGGGYPGGPPGGYPGGGYPGGPPGGYPGGPPGGPPGGYPGGPPGGYPGGPPGGYPGGPPGGFGNPGGYPGGGGFGGRGQRRGGGNRIGARGGRTTGVATPLIPLISKLRLQFTLADGRKADIVEPIPTVSDTVAGDGWYSVNVPISALKFGPGGAAMLQSVTVGGDNYGVFFIGRMQLAPLAAPPAEPAKPAADDNAAPDNPNAQQFGPMGQPNPGGFDARGREE